MQDTIHIGTRKGLFTVNRNNGSWKVAKAEFVGDPVVMLLHDQRDGYLYAVIKHGHFGTKVHRSADGGGTWNEIEPPKYPEKPEDVPDTLCPFRGTVIPWSLDMIWALEPGAAEGQLWCGTLPGGLFTSKDRGDSWEFIRTLWDKPNRAKWVGGGYDVPGIHSVAVHPNDPKKLTIGISCGGVWQSDDDGQTWCLEGKGLRAEYMPPEMAMDQDGQDPHRLVQCKAEPDKMWIQHHNGIFKSTDGGKNWDEIKEAGPATFGFAVAVHPNDGDTAWFIPGVKDEIRVPVDGKLVVTRTRDGGQSFDVLSDGLPQEHAYDLVYRHAMDIDDTGDVLAFGSTTGSLWVSEDQGDSWQTVSTHLPPVNVVRFA